MPVGVGTNVCLTVLLFDGLFVHPFVCNYTVSCMFLSDCLSTSLNIVCLCGSVHVSVRRLYAYSCVILFVTLSVCMLSFRSFVCPIVGTSCCLPSV